MSAARKLRRRLARAPRSDAQHAIDALVGVHYSLHADHTHRPSKPPELTRRERAALRKAARRTMRNGYRHTRRALELGEDESREFAREFARSVHGAEALEARGKHRLRGVA